MDLRKYLEADPFAEVKRESFGDAYEEHLHEQDKREYRYQPDPRVQEGKDTAALSVYFIKHLFIMGFKMVFYGLTFFFALFMLFVIFGGG